MRPLIPLIVCGGFLGSGKTTFLQAFLKGYRARRPEAEVLLVENDFGDVSFDAQALSGRSVRVEALAQGCICCSLAGDFTKALLAALDEQERAGRPLDLILIEPSGVGALSQILAGCRAPELAGRVQVLTSLCFVDAANYFMYLENFDAFFEDQLRSAALISLNRSEGLPAGEAEEIAQSLRTLNPRARLYWETDRHSAATVAALLGRLAAGAEPAGPGGHLAQQGRPGQPSQPGPSRQPLQQPQAEAPFEDDEGYERPQHFDSEALFSRFVWQQSTPLPLRRLQEALGIAARKRGGRLVRAKGVVEVLHKGPAGLEKQLMEVQLSGGQHGYRRLRGAPPELIGKVHCIMTRVAQLPPEN